MRISNWIHFSSSLLSSRLANRQEKILEGFSLNPLKALICPPKSFGQSKTTSWLTINFKEIPTDSQETRAFVYIKVLNYLIERVSDDDVVATDEDSKSKQWEKRVKFIFQSIINGEKFITVHNDDVFFLYFDNTKGKCWRGTCVMRCREMRTRNDFDLFAPSSWTLLVSFFKWFFQVAKASINFGSQRVSELFHQMLSHWMDCGSQE